MIKAPKIAVLAEHCPIVAWDLEHQLQHSEWTVHTATSTREVFALCSQHYPDLLLLPCGFHSGTDDLQLANQIRRSFQIPIIFVTANEDEFFHRCPDFYFGHEILYKPFSRCQFKATLQEAHRRSQFA